MLDIKLTQDLYLSAHEDFERSIADTETPWLHELHTEAITRFKELGFPGRRNEDWKHTTLDALLKTPFKLATAQSATVDADAINPYVFENSLQIVFVNGYFQPQLSDLEDLPSGVILMSLAEALQEQEEQVKPHLARYADHDQLPLTALNTAFLRDGVFVAIKNSAVIDKPIHIVHVSTAPVEPLMSFPRNLIVAGRNSQVTVVESYLGLGEQVSFTNGVTEIYADEHAIVDHYKLVRDSSKAFHIANLQVQQEKGSNVFSHYIALSGGFIRNESRTKFDGERGECTFNGLYLGRDKQHIDSQTVIDHAVPHCHSYEMYKGLLDNQARGVFNGKIYVRPDAQKTDAKQSNQCILLSDDATIDTKPQLEIYADDVKCTHGATVGQLDDTQMFYLRSRGIGKEQAKSLLIYAFANDIIQRIKVDAIRAQLEDVLLTRQALPHYEEV